MDKDKRVSSQLPKNILLYVLLTLFEHRYIGIEIYIIRLDTVQDALHGFFFKFASQVVSENKSVNDHFLIPAMSKLILTSESINGGLSCDTPHLVEKKLHPPLHIWRPSLKFDIERCYYMRERSQFQVLHQISRHPVQPLLRTVCVTDTQTINRF